MPRIYISYRPEDSSRNEVAVIRQRLSDEFGEGNVLVSTGSPMETTIALQQQVQSCDMLLVVIGRWWANMVDEEGNPLLNDPYDPVHVELDTGLQARLIIKILLVDGTSPPDFENLPEALRRLKLQTMFAVPDDLKLQQTLDDLITGIASLPSGKSNHQSEEKPPKIVQPEIRVDGQRRPVQHSSSLPKTRYVLMSLMAVCLCAVITIGVIMAATDQNPFSSPVKFELITSSKLETFEIGMLWVNDYFYAVAEVDGQEYVYFTDPENYLESVRHDNLLQLDRYRPYNSRFHLDNRQLQQLEAELGDTIAFSAIDEDDQQAIAITPNTTVYILDLESLTVKSEHRLFRTTVRKLIQDDTISYNHHTNLLMILLESNEIGTWEITDSIQYKGQRTLKSDSTYIFEFAVDRTGQYLSTRGDRTADLFRIISD